MPYKHRARYQARRLTGQYVQEPPGFQTPDVNLKRVQGTGRHNFARRVHRQAAELNGPGGGERAEIAVTHL